MALRTGHSQGAGVPDVEVVSANDLPGRLADIEPNEKSLPRPPRPEGATPIKPLMTVSIMKARGHGSAMVAALRDESAPGGPSETEHGTG